MPRIDIGVLGTSNVGRTLAAGLARAGHDVALIEPAIRSGHRGHAFHLLGTMA